MKKQYILILYTKWKLRRKVCLAKLRSLEVVLVLAVDDGAADVRVIVEAVALTSCSGGRWSLCGSGRLSSADGLSSHDAHGRDGARYGGLKKLLHQLIKDEIST